MSRNAKILIDLAVLAAVYGVWLLPKWRPLGRRTLAVYTLMYGCLASIALFTLMPVLAALPFCFDHPYVPMHMAPFEDVILRHGDYVRQIVLNIVLFIPFGVLLHRGRAAAAARISQFGHYGCDHEHDRRCAWLCALGDRARLLQKVKDELVLRYRYVCRYLFC